MSDNTQRPAIHTAGSWVLTEDGHIVGADGACVGEYHGNPRDVYAEAARVRADRALIAAAPDMLAALYECDQFFLDRADAEMDSEGPQPNAEMRMLVLVRAAIAKAEGRA